MKVSVIKRLKLKDHLRLVHCLTCLYKIMYVGIHGDVQFNLVQANTPAGTVVSFLMERNHYITKTPTHTCYFEHYSVINLLYHQYEKVLLTSLTWWHEESVLLLVSLKDDSKCFNVILQSITSTEGLYSQHTDTVMSVTWWYQCSLLTLVTSAMISDQVGLKH